MTQAERNHLGTVDVDRSIPFVDGHHHLWDLDRLSYEWLEDPGRPEDLELIGDYKMIRVNWDIERLLQQFYGSHVVKSVHVEAGYSGEDPVAETRWLQSIADEFGFPHALVVRWDMAGAGADRQLDRHLEHRNVRGVRVPDQSSVLNARSYRQGLERLRRDGLSYELSASPGSLAAGLALAKSFPDVQIILSHAGFPTQRDDRYFAQWKTELASLAKAENVSCKISGLGMVDHHWTLATIERWVLGCIEVFGVDRALFGTNWPVDMLYGSYLRQVDAYRVLLARAGLSRSEQEQLLSLNAQRLYRI